MKTCPYCGKEVQSYKGNYYCDFCTMVVYCKDVQEEGKRKNLMPNHLPDLEDVKKSTPELMTYSTIELLYMLKLARKERATVYGNRYTFIQARKLTEDPHFQQGEQQMYQEYEYYTRKCFVLENLIRGRLGYYPQKLTDSYLQNLAERMEQSAQKPMVIKNSS
ncbi:hypothetical protein [Bacillus taeanensis]|uniref:Uncharacterized protein n=1 Tax=Bacillus taeanensis TaxID=273032 RepID=A0A366XSX9_9BACI|nr:hypothetical protein [Bacillus taeanensis]RBW68255.1 hypothetical protein DS031_17945 [Bacillus taeanensis]